MSIRVDSWLTSLMLDLQTILTFCMAAALLTLAPGPDNIFVICFAVAAGKLGEWLNRSRRAQSILNKLAGTVFVGLALKIATAHR